MQTELQRKADPPKQPLRRKTEVDESTRFSIHFLPVLEISPELSR
jgi:hypothetical protein